jgi:N utilization substance protein B
MPLPPQKFREAVVQILYSCEFAVDEEIVPFMMQELKCTRKAMSEALELAKQVMERRAEIDREIGVISTEYAVERISSVERTILRLGVFELLFRTLLPAKVVIAEAIRLCRKFGTKESSQFVNAILDGVYKKHAAPAPEEPVSL